LGVDLVRFKTCSYDCIYCQLGRTTCKTVERKAWVSLDKGVAELESRLSSKPDYITLSGSGEPTLHSQVGELVSQVKMLTDIPVAVLTNGSLLSSRGVRRELLQADLVVPSLDAGDETMFRRVNRPHEQVSFERMLGGLAAFRQEYQGQYWLEVMLVRGFTDTPAEIAKLADCVNRIKPDRVQLNTVTRPPAETHATPVSPEQLEEFRTCFPQPAEVIADFRGIHQERNFVDGRDEVLAMLQRRPCSVEDIAGGLGIHRHGAIEHIEELDRQGTVFVSTIGGKRYYRAVR
jgi:wyosine [tRNA(Phe)-imidazoG37] synthetase (radical SAM superfamily)